MPSYVVTSDGPIRVRELNRPDLPDWGRPDIGLPGTPEHPWVPGSRPSLPPDWERPEMPPLPPRDEWPPLPPGLGDKLPIPPDWGRPQVPLPEEPDIDPPTIWPPVGRPEFPDISGKTLALALIYVSRHVARWHWIVIDHEEAKDKFKEIYEKHKDKLPAGGVGTPPARPQPGR